MAELTELLEKEGVDKELLAEAERFRKAYPADPAFADRIPKVSALYYGKTVWEEAVAVLLSGRNLLLAGPKATGKNLLCENLAALFGRPVWNVSFHIGTDAAGLIGTDTFDGGKVSFRKGPVCMSAEKGGFCILDEINMARNESLAVLHAALDHRRIIDVPGYDLIRVDRAARFIATMNYGYAGTRDLNEALSSRFAIITMPQITEENMLRLLRRNFPDISERIAGQFVKLFGELARKAEKSEISDRAVDMRGMLDALDLIRQGLSSGQALELTIVSKTFDRYEQTLIRDCIGSRIPADLDRSVVFAG